MSTGPNEFDLIARYFTRPAPSGFLGVGDDCALLKLAPGYNLATSTDLLIEGRHFFSDVDPKALGHKALAVNISDLASMGAQPLACLLSLSLPDVKADWLKAFSDGFYALAERAHCPLLGGDTTRSTGGVIINVTVMGQVKPGQALLRTGAKVGDDIWVTGTLGAADIALRLLQGRLPANNDLLKACRAALEWPEPPWAFGKALAGIAHAALDISDGLAQDLGHILKASACGAELDYPALPLHPALHGMDADLVQEAALAGGDVYQLCFTASPDRSIRIQELADRAQCRVSRIGQIVAEPGLRIRGADGVLIEPSFIGFDHFS
ncbi:thiamine-phosphate kinase [Pollutimonas harenae]|uniref:Thiamine-monophosphate kinase n=1 Tax=Pollutimonas harenae TaxID=657015 RepID=A0A853GLV6_9BURK|nr:thiamine-phosphate kinase [Pollutimonas harenae]NYT83978.1 thiamine-phosphate kinase [Pollutimonas harenae]TEA73594.1 thiamine-phosphate kinase [Pollutimonas harenae]